MNGLELLQELLNKINNLDTHVKLIDSNLKVLTNRVGQLLLQNQKPEQVIQAPTINTEDFSKLMQQQITVEAPKQEKQLNIAPTSNNDAILNQSSVTKEAVTKAIKKTKKKLIYKKIFGYLKGKTGNPLEEVLIMIYDDNNDVCASATTDKVGYWDTMLTPGKYSIEYKKKGFKAINKSIEFDESVESVEVK